MGNCCLNFCTNDQNKNNGDAVLALPLTFCEGSRFTVLKTSVYFLF